MIDAMTDTTTSTTPTKPVVQSRRETSTAAPEHALDPRTALLRAMEAATPILASAAGADPTLPTPCDEFSLELLLDHVLGVGERAVAMGQGRPAGSAPSAVHPDGDDWPGHWAASFEQASATWPSMDPTQPIELPWATLAAADAAAIYTSEVLVHTWDVAAAIGAPFEPAAELVAVAEAAVHQQLPDTGRADLYAELRKGMPAGLGWTDPFAEAVVVPGELTPIERLVALTGRNPKWTRGGR
jgi:uncharacterized protein (TIGR03086 family)